MASDKMVELNVQELDAVNGGVSKQALVDKTNPIIINKPLKPHTGGPKSGGQEIKEIQ